MFIVSPLTIIQSYRTHHDYHRVSQVQRIGSSKQSSSRQHTHYRYEQTAYYRNAQAAASKAANLLNSDEGAKLHSEKLKAYFPSPITGLLIDVTM